MGNKGAVIVRGGAPAAQEVVPSMEEAGLLADALKQLDEPFLVVVVGEFNSGKSTVQTLEAM